MTGAPMGADGRTPAGADARSAVGSAAAGAIRRIVAVRSSALGDVVLTTPALEALAARYPDARLTFVTASAYVPLFQGLPFLHEVLPYPRAAAEVRRLVVRLRADGPVDLYVDLQNKLRTLLLGVRLRPRRRLTFRKRGLGASLRSLFLREAPLTGRHATRMYLDALRPLGIPVPPRDGPLVPRVAVPKDAVDAGPSRPGAPRVAVAPSARWATKRWDPARFGEVAAALAARGADIVLVGGPDDGAVLDACAAALPKPPQRTDALGLSDLAATLAGCDLLISADSGPVHLASALGVPVVAVFGPTEPSRWGPSSPGSRVVRLALDCAPCSNHGSERCPLGHHACLRRLQPSEVLREALAVLNLSEEAAS